MVPSRVVVGVSGGIAAYKVCHLVRLCTEAGHDVRVVPTESALRFVGEPTWAALSGNPVRTQVWDDVHEVPHVRIGRSADLVVVAPATADLLAKAANGQADDLLTSTLLTTSAPVLIAPAMHTEMWEHPATQANVATLRGRGCIVLDPDDGRLTGADSGPGRLPDPAELFASVQTVLERGPGAAVADLAGRKVVVTAGGTREFIDPVRFIGNRSSGRQGYAVARAAAARGADVVLISAQTHTALTPPAGVQVVPVVSTQDLGEAVRAAAAGADAVVMAAAPADFRPAEYIEHKIKKTDDVSAPTISLVQNPDILAGLAADRPHSGLVVVGFAAETGDGSGGVLEHGRRKLARKGADLLVVNEVGATKGFESPENEAVILGADGSQVEVPLGSKDRLAHQIWDLVVERWAR